jgi:glycosyltransferase involved in cell wall biosynthesis
MRVLWTCNILMPGLAKTLGLRPSSEGSWLVALAAAIKVHCPAVELGFVTMDATVPSGKHVVDGDSHYVVHCRGPAPRRMPTNSLRREFAKVIADFQPDLIHINGSERNVGLIVAKVAPNIPTVLSIQGLIGPCEKVCWGEMQLWDLLRFRTLRDWLRLDGLIERRWEFKRLARMEAETLRRTRHFAGRTIWDRAYAHLANPDATYHYAQELLRSEFFDASWRLEDATPHTIFTVSASYPLKGVHVLLEAVALLRSDYPDLQVRIPGAKLHPGTSWSERLRVGGYRKYLMHRIRKLGLDENVVAIGPLDAGQMAQELLRAHVFVSPAFIENSSNALGEAMLVGTPSVAAYVGGTISMVHDRVDALCFPAGEAVLLAERIRSLFEDDTLCQTLSENARRRGRERHDPKQVAESIVAIYRSVMSDEAAGKSR